MRWSQTLIPTLRQVPGEAVVPSHQLMLRAGLIQQVAAGSYSYLPLGWRSLKKAIDIIRDEMDKAGAVEIFMPALHPMELYEATGRREAYGDNLFVVKDRHGRLNPLGPTHEEVVTDMVKRTVSSWRSLPLTLYQIQTKFRDEFRPRFGVLRSREFQMKDAYSFDVTKEGLDASYDKMFNAYIAIFKRCGLDFVTVEAESGPIGGSASHEFMVLTPTGEDTILVSDKGNYAANMEKCEIGTRPVSAALSPFSDGACPVIPDGPPKGELTKVHTPNMASIEDVGKFMKVKPKSMLKTLVFQNRKFFGDLREAAEASNRVARESGASMMLSPTSMPDGVLFVIAVVRGDHDVNEAKIKQHSGIDVEMASPYFLEKCGFVQGFISPAQIVDQQGYEFILLVDPDAAQDAFWATGANEVDHHVKYFNWNREVIVPLGDNAKGRIRVADIRNAADGDPSPKNDGGVLRASKGIEIGHVFKLGTKYSDALDLNVADEKQQSRRVIMGCYGIGVNRILAAALESPLGHDERGIIWPKAIAPYSVVITPIKYDGPAKDFADKLHDELTAAGVDVLLDDRDERPGVKFNDADLIGIPLRITIGEKGIAAGQAEFKLRTAKDPEMVALGEVASRCIAFARS